MIQCEKLQETANNRNISSLFWCWKWLDTHVYLLFHEETNIKENMLKSTTKFWLQLAIIVIVD